MAANLRLTGKTVAPFFNPSFCLKGVDVGQLTWLYQRPPRVQPPLRLLVVRIRSWTVAGAIRADRGEDGVLHALELESDTDLQPVGELGDRPMPLRPIGIKHEAKAVVVVLAGSTFDG